MRRLSPGERDIARSVFGDALRLDRVRLAAWPFRSAVTLGRVVLMPADVPRDFAAAGVEMQAWLIHELVHVHQFAVRPLWTLGSWARVLLTGGYGRGLPGYAYAHPFAWSALNLEQQARVVEHAFLVREGVAVIANTPAAAPSRRPAAPSDYAGRTPFEGAVRRT